MALRAPGPAERPFIPDAEHTILGHWEPGRWYRVLDNEGGLWMETSNPDEARDAAREHGYRLQREHRFIPAVHQWHDMTGETA